jgi:hypothetical protein
MTLHVYPLDDWIEHQVDCEASECTCPCEPSIEFFDPETGEACSEPLVIHHAVDGRE